jgi:hypothetical protein
MSSQIFGIPPQTAMGKTCVRDLRLLADRIECGEMFLTSFELATGTGPEMMNGRITLEIAMVRGGKA